MDRRQRNLIILTLLAALAVVQTWRECRGLPNAAWPAPASIERIGAWAGDDAALDTLWYEADYRNEPVQVNLERHPPGIRKLDYDLFARAAFVAEGRVLGVRRYRVDGGAKLAPFDLGIGWANMTEERVLDALRFRQRGRFLHYRWEGALPIPQTELDQSISNMHVIPANRDIYRMLRRIDEGDRVRVGGYLVDAEGPRGWSWKTSMVRTDTGRGACEILLVTQVERLQPHW